MSYFALWPSVTIPRPYRGKANDNPSTEDSNRDYFLAGIHPRESSGFRLLSLDARFITGNLRVMDERWQTEFLISSQFLSDTPAF